MSKKKRRGRKHRARISEARPTGMETVKHIPELPRPYAQAIERSPPTRGSELAGRHRLALADVKRSLVIGGAMFVLLILSYLFLS